VITPSFFFLSKLEVFASGERVIRYMYGNVRKHFVHVLVLSSQNGVAFNSQTGDRPSRPLPLGSSSSQYPLQENPLRWDKPIFGMDNETDSSFNGRRRKVAEIDCFTCAKADGPARFH